MGSVIGQILGSAVGVAISPAPIIAVILMLFSKRANANGLGFLAGLVLGLMGAGTVVLAVGVGLGIKQWMDRPSGHQEPSMPAWMASIDSLNAIKSFGLGFLLSGVNPKNLGRTVAAMATVGSSSLDSSEEFIVLRVFVAIASATVAAPVVLNLVLGERAKTTLDDAKGWLTENNNTVMAVLFVVLGAKVLGDGIAIVA